MREILRMQRGPNERGQGALTRIDLIKFEKNLKGIKVEPTHRGTGVVRRYKVLIISNRNYYKLHFRLWDCLILEEHSLRLIKHFSKVKMAALASAITSEVNIYKV